MVTIVLATSLVVFGQTVTQPTSQLSVTGLVRKELMFTLDDF